MKTITVMVPYSWSEEQISLVKGYYEGQGYRVTIIGIPG